MNYEKKEGSPINSPLMTACDEWLSQYVEDRGDLPMDFDDITWVIHDFYLQVKKDKLDF